MSDIRQELISAGGRVSQDLGLGRIAGQILVYIYLYPSERSLDDIGDELGLSKASVSIAVRQLERLGMIYRVWRKGDRRAYYKTADNFTKALQKGLVEYFYQKMEIVSSELDNAMKILDTSDMDKDVEFKFIKKRVSRAIQLRDKVFKILENPLLKIYTNR